MRAPHSFTARWMPRRKRGAVGSVASRNEFYCTAAVANVKHPDSAHVLLLAVFYSRCFINSRNCDLDFVDFMEAMCRLVSCVFVMDVCVCVCMHVCVCVWTLTGLFGAWLSQFCMPGDAIDHEFRSRCVVSNSFLRRLATRSKKARSRQAERQLQ